MNENTMSKDNALKELNIIYTDIDNIMKNSSVVDNNWSDKVSLEYIKRVDKITNKKKKLIDELKKLEIALKK